MQKKRIKKIDIPIRGALGLTISRDTQIIHILSGYVSVHTHTHTYIYTYTYM